MRLGDFGRVAEDVGRTNVVLGRLDRGLGRDHVVAVAEVDALGSDHATPQYVARSGSSEQVLGAARVSEAETGIGTGDGAVQPGRTEYLVLVDASGHDQIVVIVFL